MQDVASDVEADGGFFEKDENRNLFKCLKMKDKTCVFILFCKFGFVVCLRFVEKSYCFFRLNI